MFLYETWWGVILTYLAGAWAVSTALLRFGPRECSTTKVVWHHPERRYKEPSKPPIQARVRYTDTECRAAWHLHHLFLREKAGWIGALWPVIIPIGLLCAVVFAFVYSSASLGHAAWPKKLRDDFYGTLEGEPND